jgi:hypothetical protein
MDKKLKVIDEDQEIYPGMWVISVKGKKEPLRVLYGPYRDPECLLIDMDGHLHFLDISDGSYRVYKPEHLKYRVLYGAQHETGPFYVSDDYYWDEQDFKTLHPDKAWGFIKVIPELSKNCSLNITNKKIKSK